MTEDIVFVITKPTLLYEKIDANYLHPEKIQAVERLQELEKNGIIKISPLTKLLKNNKKRINGKDDIILPCIELADIQRDYGLINMKYNTVADAGTSTIKCKGNDILFSRLRPYLNKVGVIPNPIKQAICSGEFFVLSQIDKTIPLGYLWLVLRSNIVLSQSIHLPTGSIRPRIDEEDLDNLLVPILTDTNRIKEIDSLVTNAITNYFSALKNKESIESKFLTSLSLSHPVNLPKLFFSMSDQPSDNPRKSYRMDPLFFHPHYYDKLKDMLHTWGTKNKGEVLELQCCAKFVSRLKAKVKKTTGSIPRLGVDNVKELDILWDCDYVDADLEQTDSILQKNDLLITSTGTGSTCRVDIYNEVQPAITDGHITVIRPKSNISPYFLLAYLRTEYGKRQLLRMERGTSGQIEIYADDVKKLLVPLPEDKVIIRKAEKEMKSLTITITKAKKSLNKAMHLLDASFIPETSFDLKKIDTTIPKKEWRIKR